MPQQHRLKAGMLPDDENVVVGRHTARPIGALRIAQGLVGIEQRKTLCWLGARPAQMEKAEHRHFNPGQWIAGTRPQFLDNEVDRQVYAAEQILQEARIANL